MAIVKFPIILYNLAGKYEVCDTKDQLAMAQAKGFTLEKRPAGISFPTTLYDKKGHAVLVNDAAEKAQRMKEGYGEAYVAPPPEPVPMAPGVASESVHALTIEIGRMQERLDAAEDRLAALEAAGMQGKKNVKGDAA